MGRLLADIADRQRAASASPAGATALKPLSFARRKMYWVGAFFIGINVGVGKLVQVFLSWLNAALAPMPFAVVVVVFFLVGFSMFMNPAIPGVPVYICGGVIVPQQWEKSGGDFWAGMAL